MVLLLPPSENTHLSRDGCAATLILTCSSVKWSSETQHALVLSPWNPGYLPEGPYHSSPLKTVINEPVHTHFPRGNYVRFTWDILNHCSTPLSPRESAYRVNFICGYMYLSVTLHIRGPRELRLQLKTGLVDKLTTGAEDLHFLHPFLALGGTLELSGHSWLTHTWLTKEQKTIVVLAF